MLFDERIYKFMYAALAEAEKALESGEVPVGAVVVKDNQIIGKGYNQTETLRDPTAHAEMIAITAASTHLNDWRLNGCELYVTLEPCVMCAGAIVAARISSLYFSVFEPKYGACGSVYNIPEQGKLNHAVKVYSGIFADESERLMKEFFGLKRNRN